MASGEEKVSKLYTGDESGPLPPPETEFVPECAVPATSFRILRSALMKIFALAESVHANLGGLEAYCVMVTDEEDLTVTDVLIPRHEASGAFVRVDAPEVDAIREELRARNRGLEEGKRKWRAVGWAHSHGTMSVFFSGTDWENQSALLDSAGQMMERFGETYLTVYGMTVNVRREVYAEILSRMKCKAEIRQRGATLHIIEDVDKDDEEVQKRIYDELDVLVKERVSRMRSWGSRWREDKKKSAATSYSSDYLTEYEEDYIDGGDEISAEDLAEEIRSKVRSPLQLLEKLNGEGLKLKKIFAPLKGEEIAAALIRVLKAARSIVLEDVESIVYGDEINPEHDEEMKRGRARRGEGKYKYERIIDEAKRIYRNRLPSFGTFTAAMETVLGEELASYLAKNKSLVREKIEEAGLTFGDEGDGSGEGDGISDPFEPYAVFLSEKYIPDPIIRDIRDLIVKGWDDPAGGVASLVEMTHLNPVQLVNLLPIGSRINTGKAEHVINQTKHYLKSNADILTEDLRTYDLETEGDGEAARSLRVTAFVDSMPINRETKLDLVPFLEERSMASLSEKSDEEISGEFGAKDWEIRVIRKHLKEYYGYGDYEGRTKEDLEPTLTRDGDEWILIDPDALLGDADPAGDLRQGLLFHIIDRALAETVEEAEDKLAAWREEVLQSDPPEAGWNEWTILRQIAEKRGVRIGWSGPRSGGDEEAADRRDREKRFIDSLPIDADTKSRLAEVADELGLEELGFMDGRDLRDMLECKRRDAAVIKERLDAWAGAGDRPPEGARDPFDEYIS
jgi:hypothetical protein